MPWEPLPGSSRPPRQVGEGLDRVLDRLGAGSAGTMRAVFDRWPDYAGPEVVALARPLQVRSSTLVLAVDDPVVRSELSWHVEGLLGRLAEAVGPGQVDRIEIVVRPR